ncbi:MAG: hypothetical protein VYD19_07800, partial [Myxococcota bacterium]|nr:hypothetical protein [Myxococcota bacterium]
IFVSDGLPSDGANSRRGSLKEQIDEKIDELLALQTLFGVGEISLHTLFIATEQGLRLDEEAQLLLRSMAERGGGSYRSVPNGEQLDFLHIGFSRLRRLYSLKALNLIPMNWVQDNMQRPTELDFEGDETRWLDADQDGEIDCGEPMWDSDRDGLADLYELRIGTNPLHPDSDGDGLGDKVEWALARSGLSPLDPDDGGCIPKEPAEGQCADLDEDGFCDCTDEDDDGACDVPDSDGDGLNDCEELFVGSMNGRVDSDDDGFPDLLEFRFGTSPQLAEGRGDIDWDGTEDSVELLGGYDPRCDDAATRSRVGYARVLEERGVEGEQVCYDFSLSQVLLAPSPDGINRFLLFAGEGGFDEAARVSRWRVACVDAEVLEDGSPRSADERGRGRLLLDDGHFKPVDEFDSARDCRLEGEERP